MYILRSYFFMGRVDVGAKVEVGEIDGAEERVVGDDRVEEDVDGREKGDLGGGRAGRGRAQRKGLRVQDYG